MTRAEPPAEPLGRRSPQAPTSITPAGQPHRQHIRALVVDDSLLTRRVLSAALNSAPDLEVVGTAASGPEALERIRELRPDVVTLDVEMPQMDGLAVLREIMATAPLPVVMVSYLTREGTDATVRALLEGAVDFVPKPGGPILGSVTGLRDELVRKVRDAVHARIGPARRHTPPPITPSPTPAIHRPPATPVRPRVHLPADGFERLVILGASTGGPQALQTVLDGLRPDGSTAYIVVQHMPEGMTDVLATLLNENTALTVREARPRDRLTVDTALLAPGDWHLRLGPGGLVALDRGPKVHFVRPSVDVTLLSAAEVYGERTVAAIMTGMGSDGADGAEALHRAGGQIIAEDASTCIVWGMPRAVAQRGVADRVAPLSQIAGEIRKLLTAPGPGRRTADERRPPALQVTRR